MYPPEISPVVIAELIVNRAIFPSAVTPASKLPITSSPTRRSVTRNVPFPVGASTGSFRFQSKTYLPANGDGRLQFVETFQRQRRAHQVRTDSFVGEAVSPRFPSRCPRRVSFLSPLEKIAVPHRRCCTSSLLAVNLSTQPVKRSPRRHCHPPGQTSPVTRGIYFAFPGREIPRSNFPAPDKTIRPVSAIPPVKFFPGWRPPTRSCPAESSSPSAAV